MFPILRYEAKVSARNLYGVSNFSKPFFFATKGAGKLSTFQFGTNKTIHTCLYCHTISKHTFLLLYIENENIKDTVQRKLQFRPDKSRPVWLGFL